MNIAIKIFVGTLLMLSLENCVKDKEHIAKVYLNTPFFAKPETCYFILDTLLYKDGTIKVKKVRVDFSDYADTRAFGVGCSMSTGGSIYIKSDYTIDNDIEQSCGQYFPGCAPGEIEYNPYLNYNAPRCNMGDSLELCLLKVFPSDPVAADTSAYIFKYVFKRV